MLKDNLKGIYRHNEWKNTNYSNTSIDKTRTSQNFHIKKPNFINNPSLLKSSPIKVSDISELPKLTLNRDKLINENIINRLKIQNEKLLDQNKNLYLKLEKMTNAVKYAETKEKQAKKLYKENTTLKREYRKLHKENISLHSVIEVLQTKVNKLIAWIAKKLSCSETNITQEFEKENRPIKRQKNEMELF